jgi:hypothetical protein
VSRPRLFAELPAGLASVSLRLHGGPNCRPPISRMGNKAGYGEVILAALGLRSGQGAGRYLWAEADPDVAALLRCYPDADMLRRVAEIIRGWKDEEPRALWERLRAERRARGVRVDAEADGTAAYLLVNGWAMNGAVESAYRGPDAYSKAHGPGWVAGLTLAGLTDRCHRLAEYAAIVSSNRLINVSGPDLMNTGKGGTTFGGAEFATPVGDVAAAFERVAGEVAGYTVAEAWGATGQYCGPDRGGACGAHPPGWIGSVTVGGLVRRYEGAAQGWPAVLVLPLIPEAADVAVWMGTPGDLEGCVVYMDPPYVGTTGYAATLGRDEVVRHARAYAALGATVAISEAEVVIPEWCAVEITAGRKGQKRTFSKQQAEWLTMNREPAHRVATQPALFAVGA